MIPLFIIIPLTAAFIIALIGKAHKSAGEAIACISGLILSALSIMTMAGLKAHANIIVARVGTALPPLGISLVVDSLAAFMLVTANLVALMIAVYSIEYIRKFTDTWKFYALFSIMIAGINGVLVAGDIFNMYVFLEIAAISAYFLVAFGTEAEELEAAFKYAVMGSVASIFILLGIAMLYSYTSTLNMADISAAISAKGSVKVVLFVSVLFLMGFGLKAALVPFHAWLPYAHSSAPAPVSAMLSGVLIKVLGIYAIARVIFNIFGVSQAISVILMILAVISMILGGILAFGQTDIKKLFAYSSISQIGYIALGLGIGTPLAVFGALFHLFNHSVFKSLLFLNAGAIEKITGTRSLERIRGIIRRSPVTGYTSLIASLSICGVPPLGGFWSKLIIIFACVQANRPWLAFIAMAVSVLTLAYYFRALTPALFGSGLNEEGTPPRKISLAMGIPMLILAFLVAISAVMLLSNMPGMLLKDAAAVITGGKNYAVAIVGAIK